MITRFKGKYEFLSNFYPSEVESDGITYPTVEHAYQAAKTRDLVERDFTLHKRDKDGNIVGTTTASEVKKRGRKITIRENWDDIKVDVMRNLVHQKFQDPALRTLLLATIPHELVEGNWWGDRFWGQSPVGKGENWLGKILMEIRDGK